MKLKVCMVCAQFHPVVGGTENQAGLLSRALVERGASVIVLTRRMKGLRRRESAGGVTIHRDIIAPPYGPLYGICYLISAFLFFMRMRKAYDVIHTHLLYLHTVSAVIAARLLGKAVVVKIACARRVGDIASMKRFRGSRLMLGICRRADRFIAVSEEVRGELRGLGVGEENIVDIPNFVDTKEFRPLSGEEKRELRRRLSLPEAGGVVTFVGRLSPQKGADCLIEAWRRVARECPGAILLIIGRGELMGSLKKKAESSPSAGAIRFVGERSDVRCWLQASDVFVLPSTAEGLCNSLLEAMACGAAPVATRIGGNFDLIDEGKDGLLVEPGGIEECAGAIVRLLKDRALAGRLGARAREKIEKRYATEILVPRYIEMYGGVRR